MSFSSADSSNASMSSGSPSAVNPFLSSKTMQPIVAIRGERNGYLMIAPQQEITAYADLSDAVLLAAKAWAIQLESLGSPRAYWITLSEATPHLHIHIFPRWPSDSLKGIALFESRDTAPQSPWTTVLNQALLAWAKTHAVEILNPL